MSPPGPSRDAPASDPFGSGWSSHVLSGISADGGPARTGVARRRRDRPASPAHSLAPRSVGGILDTAFEVLRARFVTCVGFSALLWLPASILGRWVESSTVVDGAVAAGGQVVLQLVVQTVAVALVTVVVYGEMQGRHVRAGSSAMVALLRAPSLLVTTIVVNAMVFAGTLCCIAPGVLVSWLFMVTPAALVLEKLGPFQALSRSATLVRGSFWRWLGVIATQTMLVIPFSGGPALLSDPDLFEGARGWTGLSPLSFDVLQTLVLAALLGIATAFGAIVLTVFYIDTRVRTEGFDLVMRLERLRAAREPGPRESPA